MSPSSKSLEISERRSIVIMSVPQFIRAKCCAGSRASHYRLPHVGRSVNTCCFTMIFDSVDDFSQEIAVSSMISTPTAASTWVGLNINPDFSVKISRNTSNHLVNLSSSWFPSARKHVNIRCKACSSCIIEVFYDVGVHCSIWAVTSDHYKAVAGIFDASVNGGSVELTHINS